MQSLKILITLIVLIILGIIVGSNPIATMTVTFLNQPSISLPIGLWLAISIGLGLLSSSIFQFLIFLERRTLDRKIRQLQSRLKQEEEIFTYTPESPTVDRSTVEKPFRAENRVSRASSEPAEPKKSIFSSYRANFVDRFPAKSAPKRLIVDDDNDDWDAAPASNRQLDWDDPVPPRQQRASAASDNYTAQPDRSYPPPDRDRDPIRREEVYDADFRLIQPPYREPEAELDDRDRDRDDDVYPDEPEDAAVYPSSVSSANNRDYASKNADNDEDWGFDFEADDPPHQQSKPRNRKL